MFIRSVKMKRPWLWAALLTALLAAAVFFSVKAAAGKPQMAYVMETEAQRQSFIADMGWETADQYSSKRAATIPEEWNEVYEDYNSLQKQQGFDLTKYKGKEVEIYTYPVLNYPGHTDKECMQLTLMVCAGELIGGDVCCTELDGFMQGLRNPDRS